MREPLFKRKRPIRVVLQRAPYYGYAPIGKEGNSGMNAFNAAFEQAVKVTKMTVMANAMKQIQKEAEHVDSDLDIRTIEV